MLEVCDRKNKTVRTNFRIQKVSKIFLNFHPTRSRQCTLLVIQLSVGLIVLCQPSGGYCYAIDEFLTGPVDDCYQLNLNQISYQLSYLMAPVRGLVESAQLAISSHMMAQQFRVRAGAVVAPTTGAVGAPGNGATMIGRLIDSFPFQPSLSF